MNKPKRIIWGFPGIGKSTIADGINIIDADSKCFEFTNVDFQNLHGGNFIYTNKDTNYPKNYIQYIEGVNCEAVLINCDVDLLKHFDNVLVIYPAIELKEEYLERYMSRGDNLSFIDYMSKNFEGMVSCIDNLQGDKIKIKNNNVFMKDVLNSLLAKKNRNLRKDENIIKNIRKTPCFNYGDIRI